MRAQPVAEAARGPSPSPWPSSVPAHAPGHAQRSQAFPVVSPTSHLDGTPSYGQLPKLASSWWGPGCGVPLGPPTWPGGLWAALLVSPAQPRAPGLPRITVRSVSVTPTPNRAGGDTEAQRVSWGVSPGELTLICQAERMREKAWGSQPRKRRRGVAWGWDITDSVVRISIIAIVIP